MAEVSLVYMIDEGRTDPVKPPFAWNAAAEPLTQRYCFGTRTPRLVHRVERVITHVLRMNAFLDGTVRVPDVHGARPTRIRIRMRRLKPF